MDERNDIQEEAISAQDAAFERALKAAMVRLDAPEAMLQRVMKASGATASQENRVLAFDAQRVRPMLSRTRWNAWIGGAVAAVLAIGVFTAEGVHRHREHVQAEQQFAEAQAITERTLQHTREQLQRAGISIEQ